MDHASAAIEANAAQPTAAMFSLYVGDLHPDITDEQLVEALSEFKSLASVRVCKDSRTNRSLGYGYLNFTSADDATLALNTKNHMQLNGKAVRLMWSRRDSDFRKNGIGNVFVKNLSETVDHEKLQDKFKEFGNILSCKVVTSDDGSSKGYGFIQFETEDSANSAIKMMNGTIFHGKKIYVAQHVRKADRVLPSPDAQYTNLYVKNLDLDITEQVLQEHFSKFGKIDSLVIATNEHKSSKGFGFVNFENPDDARRAVEAMNGFQLGSKVLYVGRAQKKAEREQILRKLFEEKRMEKIRKSKDANVYVKNIDDSVTEDMLRDLFSQCGTITSLKIMQDEEKKISRGFGFVCFSNPEEASKAVKTFQSYMFHKKPLYVSIAQRKEERQVQLQMRYAQLLPGTTGRPSPPVITCGYHPVFFPASPGVIAPGLPRPGLIYQPAMGGRLEWRGNGFVPAMPAFQPSRPPMMANGQRQPRQIRGRMNGQAFPQDNVQTRDFSNLQRTAQAMYVPNGHARDVNNGTGVLSPIPISVGRVVPSNTAELNSLLSDAPPEQQKLILGGQLFPLVEHCKPDLAAKITGMLLEMDNSEILLLLESPDSLDEKVEEAVQVLKLAKNRSSSEESVRPFISAEQVAVK